MTNGTRGNVEPASRRAIRRPPYARGETGGGSAEGPNSDRPWHSRHDDQDAQRSPRLPEDGTPSPTWPLAKGTKSMPRSGFTVRASTRAPPMLSRLSGRNPRTEVFGANATHAEVPVCLLATVLAFNDAHEHRHATVQPCGPNDESKTRRRLARAFARTCLARRGSPNDSPCSLQVASGFASRQRQFGQVIRLGSPRDVLPHLLSEYRRMLAHWPAPCVTSRRRAEEEPSKRMPRGLGSDALSRPHEGASTRAPEVPSTMNTVSDRCGRAVGPFASTHCLV